MSGDGVVTVPLRAHDERRDRPVAIDVWHPSGTGRVGGARPWPTVVLSHGAFGASINYAWLATDLAAHGYLVAGVSHYGESFVYGPETIDPSVASDIGARAEDLSFALDHLLGDPDWSGRVDGARVGAVGHSSGGGTAVMLAGGVFDAGAMQRYCLTGPARADRGCDYGAGLSGGDGQTRRLDPRIRAVVALDPAFGPGFTAESLTEVAVPVRIVTAVDNDFLPADAHAERYAALIPTSSVTRLGDGEGHFVFLDERDSDLDANGVPLFRDRPGVDRASVHRHVAPLVRAFFDAHL